MEVTKIGECIICYEEKELKKIHDNHYCCIECYEKISICPICRLRVKFHYAVINKIHDAFKKPMYVVEPHIYEGLLDLVSDFPCNVYLPIPEGFENQAKEEDNVLYCPYENKYYTLVEEGNTTWRGIFLKWVFKNREYERMKNNNSF
jgi:hypothetical protein